MLQATSGRMSTLVHGVTTLAQSVKKYPSAFSTPVQVAQHTIAQANLTRHAASYSSISRVGSLPFVATQATTPMMSPVLGHSQRQYSEQSFVTLLNTIDPNTGQTCLYATALAYIVASQKEDFSLAYLVGLRSIEALIGYGADLNFINPKTNETIKDLALKHDCKPLLTLLNSFDAKTAKEVLEVKSNLVAARSELKKV